MAKLTYSIIAAIDSDDIVWIAVSMSVLILFALAAWIFIKKVFGSPDEPPRRNQVPFTLSQLDKMLGDGEISKEEYQLLRDQIIEVTSKNLERPQKPAL